MSSLTSSQQQAIAARGNVLVAAGAGTGKTHTLVERCIRLLLDEAKPCSLENILMVTFTDAAAAEMRHRIRLALLQKLAGQPNHEHLSRQLALLDVAQISTLHSLCLTLVRQHFHELGIDPQVAVLDERQTQPLIQETLDAIFAEHYAGTHPESETVQALIRDHARGSEGRIRALILQLHRYTQTLPEPARWLAQQCELFSQDDPTHWRAWLLEGFNEWQALWQPALNDVAQQAPNVAACVRALSRGEQSRDLAAMGAALAEVLELDATEHWPKKRKTELRKPVEKFFEEARFLLSLSPPPAPEAPATEATAPVLEDEGGPAQTGRSGLEEDWQWVRLPMLALLGLAEDFAQRFAQAKRDLGGVDFHDLEQFALQLLREPETGAPSVIARQWQERLEYVFVDECQDINAAQDKIIESLSRSGAAANRFLVGDVKQSIYRFRLAKPGIFRDYERAWQTGTTGGQWIPLSDNFRSREGVLAFANALFASLMRPAVGGVACDASAQLQFGNPAGRKPLSQAASQAPRVAFHLISKDNAAEGDTAEPDEAEADDDLLDLQTTEREARLVALQLRSLMQSAHDVWDAKAESFRPVKWSDMVVLLRAPSSRVESYAKEFSRVGVPLQAARGGFYDSAEIMDLLSLLRLLDNPLQDVPLLAVLRSPWVGLSLDELVEIRLAARKELLWTALNRSVPAQDGAAPSASAVGSLHDKVRTFLADFARWRRIAREGSLSECLETALAATHYEALLEAGDRGEERVANVRRFLALARQFDPYQRQGLFRFLRFVESQQEAGMDEDPAPLPSQDAVRLMSIHKSKGLEFPVVVVAGLGTRFNMQDLRGDVLLNEHYGLCPKVLPPSLGVRYPSLPYWLASRREKRELLGEELRLLYVAATRARDTLLLVGTAGTRKAGEPWTGEAGPITDRDLIEARCPLDWLRLWLCRTTQNAHWTDNASGANELLTWRIWAPNEPELQTPQSRKQESVPDSKVGTGAPASSLALDRRTSSAVEDTEVTILGKGGTKESEDRCGSDQMTDLRQRMTWVYPWVEVTTEPAKTTVTILRRRTVEEDSSLATASRFSRATLKPGGRTASSKGLSAAERGTAHHLFLESAALDKLGSPIELRNEAARLAAKGVLAAEQAAALDFEALAGFWQSKPGRDILGESGRVHREIPFTARFTLKELADAGIKLAEAQGAAVPKGEFVVVQGAVDLAVILPREIWLLDFKTDHLEPSAVPDKVRFYEPQIRLYALALERIYRRPVSKRWLHFLSLGRSVELSPDASLDAVTPPSARALDRS